jgi:hypothetical protein
MELVADGRYWKQLLTAKSFWQEYLESTMMDDTVFNLEETVESNKGTQGSGSGLVLFNISYDSYSRHSQMLMGSADNYIWSVRKILRERK